MLLASCFGAAALLTAGYASANDELIKLSSDAKQWVMPTGDYANTRYSELKQINADNVRKLAAGLDVLDRRSARPRGRSAGASAT